MLARSFDVRAQDVPRQEEAALHEVVVALEVAVLVLDDHVPVVAGPPQRGEDPVPWRLAKARQSRDLPAHPARQHAALVEPVAIDLDVLGLDVEDVRAELTDEALL